MSLDQGFWAKLKKPIIGLSPMDGVTDPSFRYILRRHSKPSLIVTEFTNVEGLARGAVSMLDHLAYDKSERPIVAQIYGTELDSFYKVALMCCYLDFDGIDINMGCPANKVARRGSGAGLIKNPEHAKKVIRSVKKACQDWAGGIKLEDAGLRPKIITALKGIKPRAPKRRLLPVSVKTRTGFDSIVTESWIQALCEESPAAITLHGRTFKQMYSGEANWDEIGKAAKICKKAGVIILGNGDVVSMDQARKKVTDYGVDGVLVGRAVCGNPWFFSKKEPTKKDRIQVSIEHARHFEIGRQGQGFFAIRKHLAWYCRGFDGAKELRVRLMQAKTAEEVGSILLQS